MKSFLSIKGPCCTFNGPFCPCENNFEVKLFQLVVIITSFKLSKQVQVIAKNGSKIGQVSKIYSGFVQEIYTDADNFCIECKQLMVLISDAFIQMYLTSIYNIVPIDLHVNAKATLTGALFLIVSQFKILKKLLFNLKK